MVERGSDRLLTADKAPNAPASFSFEFQHVGEGPATRQEAGEGRSGVLLREIEEGRGFLWLPVRFSIGILLYFALPQEPSAWALAGLAGALLAAVWHCRDYSGRLIVAAALLPVAAGALTMKLRTDFVTAPKLTREMSTVVTGWIAERELAQRGGTRIVIRVHDVERLSEDRAPRFVRVTVRSDAETLSVGDAVSVTARIRPPSGPVMPGGYDFARAAFYEEVGGVGFAYGAARAAESGRRRCRSGSASRSRTFATRSGSG